MAPMCKSLNPLLLVAVDVKGTRKIVDRAFSVPKWLRLAKLSEKSELLCKMFTAVPEKTKDELETQLGKNFMGYAIRNFGDFERHK